MDAVRDNLDFHKLIKEQSTKYTNQEPPSPVEPEDLMKHSKDYNPPSIVDPEHLMDQVMDDIHNITNKGVQVRAIP